MRTLATPSGLLLSLLAALPAAAQSPPSELGDGFGLGVQKFQYRVGLRAEAAMDTNVLLSSDDEEKDSILALVPWLDLAYGAAAAEGPDALHDRTRDVSWIRYRGRYLKYSDFDEFDGMETSFDGYVRFNVSNVRFEAFDEVRDRKDPYDTLQVAERLDSFLHHYWARVGVDWNRLDIELTLGRSRFTLDEVVTVDHRRTDVSLLVASDIGEKTQVFLEFLRANTVFDDNFFGDFAFQRLAVGARRLESEKLRFDARIGMGRADADSGALIPSDDFAGLVLGVGAEWDFTERERVEVDLLRQPIESVYTGLAVADSVHGRYTFTIDHDGTRPTMQVYGDLRWDRQHESDSSVRRTSWRVAAGGSYAFLDRWQADAEVALRKQTSEADVLDYTDVRVTAGVGVSW